MMDEPRVIRVAATTSGQTTHVRVAIEDRFHNFRIAARLGADRVEAISIDPIRFPYTLCPAAGARLNLLIGAARSERMSDYAAVLDSRHQCTHQFDVAALALALAARGIESRRYDIRAWGEGAFIRGEIQRDGKLTFSMEVTQDIITAPGAYAGRPLGTGFTGWTAKALSPEAAEEALLVRRMIFIARDSRHAESYELAKHAPAFKGCWVQQPEQHRDAMRLRNRILPTNYPDNHLTDQDTEYLLGVLSDG